MNNWLVSLISGFTELFPHIGPIVKRFAFETGTLRDKNRIAPGIIVDCPRICQWLIKIPKVSDAGIVPSLDYGSSHIMTARFCARAYSLDREVSTAEPQKHQLHYILFIA